MKLTKTQLKRIIQEEKQKLHEELTNNSSSSNTEIALENAIFDLKEELMGLDVGYNAEEANEVILDAVKSLLGVE